MERIDICGVRVSSVNLTTACELIDEWIKNQKKTYICVAPVSTIVDCQKDEEYRKIVNNADMVTADGMPLVWLGRWRGHQRIERTYGPDLMLALCEYGREKGYRHYLYGGTVDTCRLLEERLKRNFPGLKIVGKHSPPFRPGFIMEKNEILNEINKANPDILWIGLGSPKQDYWMYHIRPHLDCPVMIGVGAAFDFLSGVKKQAPKWLQESGLEWFYRLCCEPRRLWKRYLIGNSQFIYYVLKNCLKKKDQQQL